MTEAQTVYIIDDDTALRTAYAAALSKLGYKTDIGVDGLEGLELLKKGQPALILLDMLMPNLDGIGFLKKLRSDEANNDIPVVVVSNFESMPEADQLGVAKYMSKIQNTPEAIAAAVDGLLKANV